MSFDEYHRADAGQASRGSITSGGPDFASIAKSPNLEMFRRRGVEVLFLTDPIDEFAFRRWGNIRGRSSTSIDSADIEIPETAPPGESRTRSTAETPKESGFARVLDLFRAAVGNRVSEVRESKRLTDSPCCLVNAEGGLSTQMQRILKLANKDFTEGRGSSRSIRRRHWFAGFAT